MIHARIPIAWDFLGPKGSLTFRQGFCGGGLTFSWGRYYHGVAF